MPIVSDRISIINALMHEDRNEIRMNKNTLLNSTYFVVSGIIAITAFSISQNNSNLKGVLLVGMWSLFLLYILAFVYFMKHLTHLRRCLDIREEYYHDFSHLENEKPFNPLKQVDPKVKPSMSHKYLWFLPIVTALVSIVNSVILLR